MNDNSFKKINQEIAARTPERYQLSSVSLRKLSGMVQICEYCEKQAKKAKEVRDCESCKILEDYLDKEE